MCSLSGGRLVAGCVLQARWPGSRQQARQLCNRSGHLLHTWRARQLASRPPATHPPTAATAGIYWASVIQGRDLE